MDEASSEIGKESVDIYDSRLAVLVWFLLCVGLIRSSVFLWDWGPIVAVAFGPHAVYLGTRLLRRPVRFRISEKGIVDRSIWPSSGFIPWEEILGFRSSRWGLIEVRLLDEDAFLQRQSVLFFVGRLKALYRGQSPAGVWTPFLGKRKGNVLAQLETGLDAYTLATVRRERLQEGGCMETTSHGKSDSDSA